MKNKLIISALALNIIMLVAAAACAQTSGFERTTTRSDRLDFGAGGSITVNGAVNGSVEIKGTNKAEIEINAEIKLKAGSEADLDALANIAGFITQESLGSTTIQTLSLSDRSFVKQLSKKIDKKTLKRLALSPYSVAYVISVPRFCDLIVNSGSGPVKISGVEGNIRLNAVDSAANIQLIGGSLAATVGDGSMSITMPDRSWRGGPIDVSMAKGELAVQFPANLSAELDANILRTGTIVNHLENLKPRDRKIAFTDRSIAAKAGSGGVAMKLTVGDGTLKLLKLGQVE